MNKISESKKIGFYLERTTRIVKLSYSQALKEHGIDLTPEQWVILDALDQADGLSQKELANKSFKDAPTISRIIDLLENKNYVSRKTAEDDRRRFQVYLTEQGEMLVTKARPVISKMRSKGWQSLDKGDYENFIRIMNTIFSNYG